MTQRTDIATVDELHASATKLTGLDDFGADDDAKRSDEVGARPLAASRLGVPPPACGGEAA